MQRDSSRKEDHEIHKKQCYNYEEKFDLKKFEIEKVY